MQLITTIRGILLCIGILLADPIIGRSDEFRIDEESKFLITQVQVDGAASHEFLIDTGSQLTALDLRLKDENLEPILEGKMLIGSHMVPVETGIYLGPRLRLGESIDWRGHVGFLDLRPIAPLMGVIGIPALRGNLINVNWDSKSLSVEPSSSFAPEDWTDYQSIPIFIEREIEKRKGIQLNLDSLCVLVHLPLVGYEWFHLDTGYSDGGSIPVSLFDGLTIFGDCFPYVVVTSAMTFRRSERGSLALSRLGDRELKGISISGSPGRFLLGITALANFNFALDIDRKLFLVGPRKHPLELGHNRNFHGMGFGGDDPEVLAIIDGSPADTSGVKISDIVHEINGISIQKASDAISIIREHVDEALDMILMRDGSEINVEFTPTDFYPDLAPSHEERLKTLEGTWLDDPMAAVVLGRLYKVGEYVEQDFDKAKQWYQRAAFGGVPKADYFLANLKLRTEKNPGAVVALVNDLKGAATKRVPEAALKLGQLYLGELDIERDEKEAYRWFSLASTAGVREAIEPAEKLKHLLSEEEQQEIESWIQPILNPVVIRP